MEQKDLGKGIAVLFLVILFLAVGSLRSYYALSTPALAEGDAYYALDQARSILEYGIPQFSHPLSYHGGSFFISGFYYVLALFGLFIPLEYAVKIVTQVFFASLVFPVFTLLWHLFKKRHIALIGALAVSFIPVLWKQINAVSSYSLVLPLLLWLLYFFFRLREKKFLVAYFIFFSLLLLIHPSISVFIIALLFYLILLQTEHVSLQKTELEVILTSIFLLLLVYSIFFKKLLLKHGIALIWMNLPQQLISDIFATFTILDGIYLIGLLPFAGGIFSIYYFIFKKQFMQIYLLISLAIIITILVWLGLFPLYSGLMMLGVLLVLLASFSYHLLFLYFEKTKFSSYFPLLIASAIVLLVFTSLIPSFSVAKQELKTGISEEELQALIFIRENIPRSAIIFGDINDGYLITSIAKRKNIIEPNFLMAEDASERYEDVKNILTSKSSVETISLLEKYGVDYIYISKAIIFNPDAYLLKFMDNSCFIPVYNDLVTIYALNCTTGGTRL